MSCSSANMSQASRICGACGLCCNGVMFHTVRLQPDDSPKELAALGLRLKRKRGHDLILQPCPAFLSMQCSIYARRPTRCRKFECRQLQRVASGTITEEDALAKIREVQRRVLDLEQLSLRPDGRPGKGPIAKRCESAMAETFDPGQFPERVAKIENLAMKFRELDALLDSDFRLPPDIPSPEPA